MFDHHFDQIGPHGMAEEASQNTQTASNYVSIILEGKSRSDTLSNCKFALLRQKVERLGGHCHGHSHSHILFILVGPSFSWQGCW
jgi:hypothetical protein